MKKIKKFLFSNTSVRQTVMKNAFWLSFGEIASRLLKLILIIYAARVLGASGWGIFSYVLSFVGIFFVFSDSGINGLVTREASKTDDADKIKYLSTAFYIKLFLSFFSLVIGIVISPYMTTIPNTKALIPFIALLIFFETVKDFGFSLNRAFEKMENEALVKIITNCLIVIFGLFFLIFGEKSPLSLSIAYTIGSGLGMLLIFWILRDHLKALCNNFSKKFIVKIFASSWSLAILILVGNIMDKTDTVMLSFWKTATDIGWYSASQRIFIFLAIIPGIISLATFPSFSRHVNIDNQKFRKILEKSLALTFLFAAPIAVGGIIFGKEIILLVFGGQYLPAAPVFQILMGFVLLAFPNLIITNAIFAYNKQNETIVYAITGMIINIVLNYLLIPTLGIIGSVIASVFSLSVVILLVWSKLKKINYFETLRHTKKIFFCTFCMGIFTLTLRYFHFELFLNVFLSCVFYFGLLYLLKEELIQEALGVLQN